MSIVLSTHNKTKLGFGSEPTPKSVKEHVTEIEATIIKEIGAFTPFSNNMPSYKQILSGIQEDLKSVRPIIEYVYASGGERAFAESNIKDTFDRYQELRQLVKGESSDLGMPGATGMEGAPGIEGAAAEGVPETEGLDLDPAAAPAGEDPLAPNEPEPEAGAPGAESLLNAMHQAILVKHAIGALAAEPVQGLSNKIEKLYFLGRINQLDSIKKMTERVIKIGELLAMAINNDGRPTMDAISKLNAACKDAATDISVVESAAEALNSLPDKLESIVILLKNSLLERIKEIKGEE